MSGIKCCSLNEVLNEAQIKQLNSCHPEEFTPSIIALPGNYIMPRPYEKYADKIFNFEVRNDDIFVHGWIKTGTNWTQELVWSVMNYENIEIASETPLHERAPALEMDMVREMMCGETETFEDSIIDKYEFMNSPRIFKTHLPYALLPPKLLENCKVVTCLRNPKDIFVSLYHYYDKITPDSFNLDFEALLDSLMDDLFTYCPYWDTTLEQWSNRDHPNMCLLFYEDMKRDFAGSIRKVAEFLKKDISESAVEDLVERLSFKKLKEGEERQQMKAMEGNSQAIHQVYRKGEIGDWKNHFTKEMNERMDKKIAEKFKDTGLKFTYE